MKFVTAFFLCFIFLCSSVSYSQGLSESLGSHDPFEIDNEQYQPKSPAIAGLLTISITTGSILTGRALLRQDNNTAGGILLASGLLLGPSVGNIYVGNKAGVFKGIGTRLLSSGVMATGLYLTFTSGITGLGVLLGGAALFIHSSFFDWVNSMDYARKLNQRHAKIQVSPGVDTHTRKPTLGLNIRF